MQIVPTKLPGVVVIAPKVFGDARGFFVETWQQQRYQVAGIAEAFVQDNLSRSSRGVVRGLHFQNPNGQGKLVSVLIGEVFDVAVDVRRGSPTFGQWVGEYLSGENHKQLYVPPGFAHGFAVTSETALFSYKCTDYYNKSAEFTVAWNDADLAIPWPVSDAIISEKDRVGRALRDFRPEELPSCELRSAVA